MYHGHYYGFPLCYRVESRGDKKGAHHTLILSYRDSKDKDLRYEHGPRRITEELVQDLNDPDFLEKLPPEYIEDFAQGFLGLESPKGEHKPPIADKNASPEEKRNAAASKAAYEGKCLARSQHQQLRRRELELPLAMLIAADRKYLVNDAASSKSIKEKRNNALDTILLHEGSTIWKKVDADSCKREWLNNLSTDRKANCVRMIKRLFFRQETVGATLPDNPWNEFRVLSTTPRVSGRRSCRYNIEQAIFEQKQCVEIIKACMQMLHAKARYKAQIGLAVLLKLTLGLSNEELCGLNWTDFQYLTRFPARLVVHLGRQFSCSFDGAGKNTLCSYEGTAKDRVLALPALVRFYIEEMQKPLDLQFETRPEDFMALTAAKKASARKNAASSTQDTGTSSNVPTMPVMVRKDNAERRENPQILADACAKFLDQWAPQQRTQGAPISLPSVLHLAENTAFQNAQTHGLDFEQMRHQRGLAHKQVSGKHYHDFVNERELNKVGATLDAWMDEIMPESPHRSGRACSKSNVRFPCVCEPGMCTNLQCDIEIKAMSPDTLPSKPSLILIGASRGLSGSIEFLLSTSNDSKEPNNNI